MHPPAGYTYYAYDAAGRTASIADRKSDGTAICSFAFTRDANGNIARSLREARAAPPPPPSGP